MILAGDAGATKTELGVFESVNGKLIKRCSRKYPTNDFSSLDQIITAFLIDCNFEIDSACIGIAGPVIDGIGRSTNLPWIVNERILSEKFNIPEFKLANDLEIIAAAVSVIEESDLIPVYNGNGKESKGNKAILAPGTGLGQAALIFNKETKYEIIPTEGGHTDFAASETNEIELFVYLKKKFGHVSYERIASGMGLVNVFNFLLDSRFGKLKESTEQRLRNEDAAAVISDEALKKNCLVCEKALDIFASVLGAQAGNMVLNYIATGGIYLGGGIPVKICDKLNDGTFLRSYLDKGRLSYLTERTPVYIIKDTSAGLKGAALLVHK